MRRLLLLVPVLAACGSSKKQGSKTSPQQAATTQGGQASGGCKRVAAPAPKGKGHEKKPKGELDDSKPWSLVVRTNCGAFTIALDVKRAPHTAASLVALAKSHFFDGTTFHRIVPGFVIQGGDPTGTGGGGPGYKTVDKPPADAKYVRGVVAMAKTAAEPDGTAGSQFFVVTGQDAGLPPQYAIVGRVLSGLDVVEKIGQLGDPSTEQPTQPVVMQHVTVAGG
jgi:cyclophilin family peptidyl-prolyl cis-trans isomerase